MSGRNLLVPVDTVKPKRSTDLQRVRNLNAEPRCALLVDHYSDDWDELWWVRVTGTAMPCPPNEFAGATALLAARHPQYSGEGSVVSVYVITALRVTGWSAL